MTEEEFRGELSRLYAVALDKGLMSDDLAAAAKCSRHTIARWIGGYASPATPEARESVILAVAHRLS